MGGGNPTPSKRGKVTGWSAGAVRRHTKWLYSVDTDLLHGEGFAFTLTMRDTPESADVLHAMRRAWLARAERLGAFRFHWVIEWQRRGTPHIHAALYFRDFDALPEMIRTGTHMRFVLESAWSEIAAPYRAVAAAQHSNEIGGPLGWLQYLSKHAARGVAHYQRMGHPEGWERTGRLWGYGGDWPVDAPARFDMSRQAYWRYRRLVRSWRTADARSRPLSPKQGAATRGRMVKSARGMLACPLPKLSAVRGVSDWIPEHVTLQLIDLLQREGHLIIERDDE